jgi:hypothetical protein
VTTAEWNSKELHWSDTQPRELQRTKLIHYSRGTIQVLNRVA